MTFLRIIWVILKNLLTGLRVLLLILIIVAAGVLYWKFFREPKVEPNTILVMNMQGIVLDVPPMARLLRRLAGEDIQTLQGMLHNIKKASADKRISGILLNMKNYGMSFSIAQEIRDALIQFKESEKKLFTYMESAGMLTYFLVSPADKIYLSPSGYTHLIGLRAEIPFYRKMLDKIGITPEFVYIGKYKTAPQSFTRDSMSEDHREVMNALLDDFYEGYVEQVASTRKVALDQVKAWIDDGLYTAPESLKVGMVDELIYENQLDEKIKTELGITDQEAKLNKLNNAQYARVNVQAPDLHKEGEKVAIVYAEGTILSGESSNFPGDSTIGSESMTKLLRNLAEDKDIKGIILRINSGGGSAQASGVIWNGVQEAEKKKPVVVSMADVAASGAYYISAPADSIVAYPLTITGSIGIFGGKFSMKGLYDWIGMNIESLQRGKNAGMFTSTRTFTEEEQERFRQFVQAGYDEFIGIVSQGRKMNLEAVDAVAQGRVWTGKRALEVGLVDKLGGIETAIEIMKEKIGVPKEQDIELILYPKVENLLQVLLKRLGKTQLNTKLPDDLREIQRQLEELARLENEHFFAWWPYQIKVE